MSVKLMSAVFELGLPPGQRLLLVKLADHAEDNGTKIYPSVQYLKCMTGLGERTVRRFLGKFVDDGVLVIVRPGGGKARPTEYWMDIDRAKVAYPMSAKDIEFLESRTSRRTPKVAKAAGFASDKQSSESEKSGARSEPNPAKMAGYSAKQVSPNPANDAPNPANRNPNPAKAWPTNHHNHQDTIARASAIATWQDAIKALRDEGAVDDGEIKSWLDPLTALSESVDQLILRAPSRFFKEYVSQNHLGDLIKIIGKEIEITVGSASPERSSQ